MKDYAKRPADPKKPSRKKAGLTLFIITLAIGLPALMFYVKFHKIQHIKKPATLTTTKAPTSKKPEKNTTDFDFYTLLPKSQ